MSPSISLRQSPIPGKGAAWRTQKLYLLHYHPAVDLNMQYHHPTQSYQMEKKALRTGL